MSVKSQERKKKYAKTTLKYRKMGSGFNNSDDSRIRKVAIEMVESEGTKPLGKIMIENGYSEAYAKNPQKLTRTKAWENAMEGFIPLERIAKKLSDKLEAKTTVIRRMKNGEDKVIKVDNDNIQIKALELALKTRGLINKKQGGMEGATKGFSLVDLARSAVELNDQIEERAKQREEYKNMHKESGVIDLSKV
jgi:hypothetical protein